MEIHNDFSSSSLSTNNTPIQSFNQQQHNSNNTSHFQQNVDFQYHQHHQPKQDDSLIGHDSRISNDSIYDPTTSLDESFIRTSSPTSKTAATNMSPMLEPTATTLCHNNTNIQQLDTSSSEVSSTSSSSTITTTNDNQLTNVYNNNNRDHDSSCSSSITDGPGVAINFGGISKRKLKLISSSLESPPNKQPRRGCKNDGINPQCVICQDFASGRHYGVFACEGCKGFFRRTILATMTTEQKLQQQTNGPNPQMYKGFLDIYKCNRGSSRDERCEILVDLNRRRCCKSCRFKKCIDAGMKYEPSAVEPKMICPNPIDVIFQPETINFQKQLYQSYELYIGSLMNQFKLFLFLIGELENRCKAMAVKQDFSPKILSLRQHSIIMVTEYLGLLTDEMLRKFISFMEDFREISIETQADIVVKCKNWLMCIVLAMIYPTIEKYLKFESIVFGEQTFHDNLVRLHEKLKIIGNEVECNKIAKQNDDYHQTPPLTIIQSVEKSNKNQPNACKFIRILTNEQSFQYVCHKAYLNSRVLDSTEDRRSAQQQQQQQQQQHQQQQQQQQQQSDNNKRTRSGDLNNNTIHDLNFDGQNLCFVDDDHDEKKLLIALKQKYRFLPLLLAFILIRNCHKATMEQPVIKVRNTILNILSTEYRLHENITGLPASLNPLELSSIFNNPQTDNSYGDGQNNVFCRFSLSRLFSNFEDVSRIVARLVAIIRLKFSILI